MPKSISIIEVDPDILELMTHIPEEEGHQVFPSRICQSLEQIVAMRPDLILIDNRFSDCFGKDACLKIKEQEGTSGSTDYRIKRQQKPVNHLIYRLLCFYPYRKMFRFSHNSGERFGELTKIKNRVRQKCLN